MSKGCAADWVRPAPVTHQTQRPPATHSRAFSPPLCALPHACGDYPRATDEKFHEFVSTQKQNKLHKSKTLLSLCTAKQLRKLMPGRQKMLPLSWDLSFIHVRKSLCMKENKILES